MKTNIDLDEQLVKQGFAITGLRTKKELVNFALAELVKRNTQKDLIRSNIDCAISIMAIENHLTLYHCDRDFEALSKHTVLKQKKLNLRINNK